MARVPFQFGVNLSGAAPQAAEVASAKVGPQMLFRLADILSQKADADARGVFDTAWVGFQTSLNEELQQALQAEDANGLLEGFTTNLATRAEELEEGIDESYLQQFRDRTQLSIAANTSGVINHAMKLEDQRFGNLFEAHVVAQEQALMQDPTGPHLEAALAAVDDQANAYEATNVWDPIRRDAQLVPARQRITLAMVDTLLRDDRFGDVLHLAHNGAFSQLEPKQYDSVVREALNGVRSETYFAMLEDIETARRSGDPSAFVLPGQDPMSKDSVILMEEAITAQLSAGLLERGQASQLRMQLGYAIDSMKAEIGTRIRLQRIYDEGGQQGDKDDVKAVESLAEQIPRDNLEAHEDLIRKTAIVAPSTVRTMNQTFENGSPEEVAKAYRILDAAHTTPSGPYVFGGTDAESEAVAQIYRMVTAGALDLPTDPQSAGRIQMHYRKLLDEKSKRPELNTAARLEQRKLADSVDFSRELASLLVPGSNVYDKLAPQMTMGFDAAELEDNEDFLTNALGRMTLDQRKTYQELLDSEGAFGSGRTAATYAMMALQPEVGAAFEATVHKWLTEGDRLTLGDAMHHAALEVSQRWFFQNADADPRLMRVPYAIDPVEIRQQMVDWATQRMLNKNVERQSLFSLNPAATAVRLASAAASRTFAEFIDVADYLSTFHERAYAWATGKEKGGIDPEHPWSYTTYNQLASERNALLLDPNATPAQMQAKVKEIEQYEKKRAPWYDELMQLTRPSSVRRGGFRIDPVEYEDNGQRIGFRVYMVDSKGVPEPITVDKQGREALFWFDNRQTRAFHEQIRRQASKDLEARRDDMEMRLQEAGGRYALPGTNLSFPTRERPERAEPRDSLREFFAGRAPMGRGMDVPFDPMIPETANPLRRRLLGTNVGLRAIDPETGETIATLGPQDGEIITLRGDEPLPQENFQDPWFFGGRIVHLERETGVTDLVDARERLRQLRFWIATKVPSLRWMTPTSKLKREAKEIETKVRATERGLSQLRRRTEKPEGPGPFIYPTPKSRR